MNYKKNFEYHNYFYKGRLHRMYKKEFLKRRINEIETSVKDPILERFRAGLVPHTDRRNK